MEVNAREVRAYKLKDGTCPFKLWRRSISDLKVRRTIDERIDRAALGNVGDCRSVGDGVFELKIHIGPGYRIYFHNDGLNIILLLIGGDKSTQQDDIKSAQAYLKDYKERLANDKTE